MHDCHAHARSFHWSFLLFLILSLPHSGPSLYFLFSLRVRQLKALGDPFPPPSAEDESAAVINPIVFQRQSCEAETLRVFRLLTSQVFGKLIIDNSASATSRRRSGLGSVCDKERSILFCFVRDYINSHGL